MVKRTIRRTNFLKRDLKAAHITFKGSESLHELLPIILLETCELNANPYRYRMLKELCYLEQRGYVVKQAGFGYDFIIINKSKNENSS